MGMMPILFVFLCAFFLNTGTSGLARAAKGPAGSLVVAQASPPGRAVSGEASSMDFDELGRRLADTNAVGIFTKLSLKRNVDRLEADLRAYHGGEGSADLKRLRQRYNIMVQEIVLMVQRKDPTLARDVSAARGPLWGQLSDKQKFANL